jgi:SAM-dependent methyltransferase
MIRLRIVKSIDQYAKVHPQLRHRAHLPHVLAELVEESARQGKIVDIGCGEGSSLEAMERLVGRAALLGIDLSMIRVRRVQEKNIRAVVADALRLPLSAGAVSLAVCRHVIEHVQDDERLAIEVSEVLQPGGHLYLETPLRLSGAWYPYRNQSGNWVLDPTHVREYTRIDQVIQCLAVAGLKITYVDVQPIGYPILQLVQRALHWLFPNDRRVNSVALEGPRIRIPRYRELRIVAKK